MPGLSRKTVLAIEAVLDIAYHGRSEPVQAKEITARQGVPQRYLEQVMQQLVHEGVLKGVRGPKGGYVLARERRRISVADIVQIVARMEAADDGGEASTSALGAKVVGPMWREAQTQFLKSLSAVTIETLCHQAHAAGVARGDDDGAIDFTI